MLLLSFFKFYFNVSNVILMFVLQQGRIVHNLGIKFDGNHTSFITRYATIYEQRYCSNWIQSAQ